MLSSLSKKISEGPLFSSIIRLKKSDSALMALTNLMPQEYSVTREKELQGLIQEEMVCLFYTLRGKTTKEIEHLSSYSQLTVEQHN